MKKKTIGILASIIMIGGVLGIFVWPNPVIQNPSFACALTEGNPQGPYYIAGAPYKEKLGEELEGQKIIISGQVLNQNCDPIPEAIIDVWHTDSNGNYYFQDFTLRGKIKADENGQYKLETRFPGKYSEAGLMRPAHIHVKVSAPNLSSHTTQLYFEGDEHLDFFVKPSLILKLDEKNGTKYSEFDFVIFTP
ncbi:MAG: putative Intradiol ring-cleavage dioxygenase [Nitrosopumilales archaeon]|nr:MAG: putative Intradiol ring-cleavage dioxygenase [Nitrosopumilales archaeon]